MKGAALLPFLALGLRPSTAWCVLPTQGSLLGRERNAAVLLAHKGEVPQATSRRDFAALTASAFATWAAVLRSAAHAEEAGEPLAPAESVETASQLSAAADAAAAAAEARNAAATAFDFQVPYNGKQYPMSKFLGKATLLVNCKIDDPISLEQMPALVQLAAKYRTKGLKVVLVPTDQGYFEADEDRVVKIKIYQQYGFGQFPASVVLDKIDIVSNTAHPLLKYLCRTLKNPNGIGRFTLDYEKFLLDEQGRPLRRYPRKLMATDFEQDIAAALDGKPLPEVTPEYTQAWTKAAAEAERSEYAFKPGLNYYFN